MESDSHWFAAGVGPWFITPKDAARSRPDDDDDDALMVKIGESFPPEHFFKIVFGIWILVQLGVMVTLRVRRRRQAMSEKQD